jgi:hypothetical protein
MKMKVCISLGLLTVLINCSTTKSIGNKSNNSMVETINIPNTIVKKDSGITDTLHYVQSEFIAKKEKYINKPFDSILNNLRIDIKSYQRGLAHNNRYIIPHISISFCTKNETSYRAAAPGISRPVTIWIKWQNPLPADSIHQLLLKSINPGDWGVAEHKYFGKQIVKDFGIDNYMK